MSEPSHRVTLVAPHRDCSVRWLHLGWARSSVYAGRVQGSSSSGAWKKLAPTSASSAPSPDLSRDQWKYLQPHIRLPTGALPGVILASAYLPDWCQPQCAFPSGSPFIQVESEPPCTFPTFRQSPCRVPHPSASHLPPSSSPGHVPSRLTLRLPKP